MNHKNLFLLVAIITCSLALMAGCVSSPQFGAPETTGATITGRVATPESCFTGACDNPSITDGKPLPLATALFYGGDSGQLKIQGETECDGSFGVSAGGEGSYVLYAVRNTSGGSYVVVKKGINGSSGDVGEANAYTTSQVIIWERANFLYGENFVPFDAAQNAEGWSFNPANLVLQVSDIPNLLPTGALLAAVEKALSECRDPQKDGDVIKFANQIADATFGAPGGGGAGGGGGGGGTTIIVGPTPTASPTSAPTTLYKITGTVYVRNENGELVSYDNSEEPIVLQLVKKSDNTEVGIASTKDDGTFEFSPVPAGEYVIKIISAPEGYDITALPKSKTVTKATSDANIEVVIVNADSVGNNFLLEKTSPKTHFVDGYVFEDQNDNGTYDDGEGIVGIEVKLNVVSKTRVSIEWNKTTDENGYYKFVGLENGVKYRVRPIIANTSYGDATPNNYQFTINGSNLKDKNFQLKRVPAYCISGYTYENGTNNPVQNVTVKLLDHTTGSLIANTTSDTNGLYQFCNLSDNKTYRIRAEIPSGYTNVDPNRRVIPINGADVTDAHFWFVKASAPVYTLTGVVYASDETCDTPCGDCDQVMSKSLQTVAGIKVVLKKYNTSTNSWDKVKEVTTDGNGVYVFANNSAGEYRIVVPVPQSNYPYVTPEKYQGDIATLSDSNLDFTLSCCKDNPCCEAPTITKITLDPSCECPTGYQAKTKTCQNCNPPLVCTNCKVKVEVSAENAASYKYELYIDGELRSGSDDWISDSSYVFEEVDSVCQNKDFSVKVYAKNDCNQEVSATENGIFPGGECEECCKFDFFTSQGQGQGTQKAKWENGVVKIKFQIKDVCQYERINLKVEVFRWISTGWLSGYWDSVGTDNTSFTNMEPNPGGNITAGPEWESTSITGLQSGYYKFKFTITEAQGYCTGYSKTKEGSFD